VAHSRPPVLVLAVLLLVPCESRHSPNTETELEETMKIVGTLILALALLSGRAFTQTASVTPSPSMTATLGMASHIESATQTPLANETSLLVSTGGDTAAKGDGSMVILLPDPRPMSLGEVARRNRAGTLDPKTHFVVYPY
jgi:hypothetical protein